MGTLQAQPCVRTPVCVSRAACCASTRLSQHAPLGLTALPWWACGAPVHEWGFTEGLELGILVLT